MVCLLEHHLPLWFDVEVIAADARDEEIRFLSVGFLLLGRYADLTMQHSFNQSVALNRP